MPPTSCVTLISYWTSLCLSLLYSGNDCSPQKRELSVELVWASGCTDNINLRLCCINLSKASPRMHGLFLAKFTVCNPCLSPEVQKLLPVHVPTMGTSVGVIYVVVTNKPLGFFGGSDGEQPACKAGDMGSIPGLGRSPGWGDGNSL